MTLGYIKNRFIEIYHHKTYPAYPWLTHKSNEILASYLKESDIGLEFGSGRSTLWFARHTKHLTSIEHDEGWYKKVKKMLNDNNLHNVNYHLIQMDKQDDEKACDVAYVDVVEKIDSNSLDFVLVDGVYRGLCALKSLRVIRPGGILIIDNVNWYLPSDSRSPNSRTMQQGPKGKIWEDLHQSISQWRKIWTSSNVTDTALFFKPTSNDGPDTI